MPVRKGVLVLSDIYGISIQTTPKYALKVSMDWDFGDTAHNAAAILTTAAGPALHAVLLELFENVNLRAAAQNALQQITDDEAAEAEKELEEFERQQAIKQGPALTED